MGISFPNPVGIAAGLDKNADYLCALESFGFGFIEVGTVTPRAQPGNPKPRLFRYIKTKTIVNHMGFNNAGVNYLIKNIKKTNYKGILGISISQILILLSIMQLMNMFTVFSKFIAMLII